MHVVLDKLLRTRNHISPSKGPCTEYTGVLLEITNPRARLSRTEGRGRVFSPLGELMWYLAPSNSLRFIAYYISRYRKFTDEGRTLHGAYGPRLFKMRGTNQIENVVATLREKRFSRQAVIQLFDAPDIAREYKDVPCTCTMQFMIRRDRLEMFTSMRSNDAFVGLPHDVFCFTMLQEIVARTLGVEVGRYKHAVGSLHLYDENRGDAQRYLNEGWQHTIPMPAMPVGDPWPSIRTLRTVESKIRTGKKVDPNAVRLDPYWQDLVRLLLIYRHRRSSTKIAQIRKTMSSDVYDGYIDQKKEAATKKAKRKMSQLKLL